MPEGEVPISALLFLSCIKSEVFQCSCHLLARDALELTILIKSGMSNIYSATGIPDMQRVEFQATIEVDKTSHSLRR